jgi:hypothetical protein
MPRCDRIEIRLIEELFPHLGAFCLTTTKKMVRSGKARGVSRESIASSEIGGLTASSSRRASEARVSAIGWFLTPSTRLGAAPRSKAPLGLSTRKQTLRCSETGWVPSFVPCRIPDIGAARRKQTSPRSVWGGGLNRSLQHTPRSMSKVQSGGSRQPIDSPVIGQSEFP